jgi:hypothetical protein
MGSAGGQDPASQHVPVLIVAFNEGHRRLEEKIDTVRVLPT